MKSSLARQNAARNRTSVAKFRNSSEITHALSEYDAFDRERIGLHDGVSRIARTQRVLDLVARVGDDLGLSTVLTLHTVGLALLVGANWAFDLRVLGVGDQIELAAMAK